MSFSYLVAVFILVPVVELVLLIKIGAKIGALNTVAVVFLTGVGGAYLARSQGLRVLMQVKSEMESGIMPSESLIDGVLVLAGGILLLTPGFMTDLTGFAALIPFTRNHIKNIIKKRIRMKINSHYYIDAEGS